jgi:exopolysaccharide biosynthesis polyprenyl glycosylphosphotransferase
MKIANRFRQKYTIYRIISDSILIPITVVTAYFLKFKIGWFFQNILSLQFGRIYQQAQIEPYLSEMWVITVLWIATFYFMGMYRQFSGVMPEVDEWVTVVKGVSMATIELMAFTFIYKSFPGSRFVIGYIWILGIGLLLISRTIIFQYELNALRRGKGSQPTLVIGNTELAQDIIEKMLLFPTLGLQYIGSIGNPDTIDSNYHVKDRLIFFGPLEKLPQILSQHRPEIAILADYEHSKIGQIRTLCTSFDTELRVVSKDTSVMTSIARIEEFDGIPITRFYHYAQSPMALLAKATLDRVGALIGLAILSPVFLIIAFIIKRVSPTGPIFFSQDRVGLNGTLFPMIKFRTMIPDAEAHSGPVMVKEKNETRYIKYGAFLRKTSLDELPQLINVLRGEMSLVGPRPERPFFVTQFTDTIPHFPLRHLVKGGITGWAQINGRSALTNRPDHKIKYDLYYIKNWTLLLDIKILLKTIWIVLRREDAY